MVISLFIICIALYFVFDTEDIQEWMITIIMSIGCMLLTVISTGGVICIQNRQNRVYRKIQKKFKRKPNTKCLRTDCNTDKTSQQQEILLKDNDEILSALGISTHDESGHKISGLTASMSSQRSHRFQDGKKRSQQSISKSIIEADAKGQLELSQVITNPKFLNLFAQFLCNEFNVENLLFIIEIVQFKRYIKENESDHSSVLGEFISIPQHQDLPHFDQVDKDSMISVTDPNVIDVYKYGLYIVNKYIVSNSSHEINISHRNRKCIVAKAKDLKRIRELSVDNLQVLFDAAFVEILLLLQDPLSRFASWEEFNVYLRAIGPTAYPFFPRCTCVCFCWCCCAENTGSDVMDDKQELLSYP